MADAEFLIEQAKQLFTVYEHVLCNNCVEDGVLKLCLDTLIAVHFEESFQ